MHLESLLMTFHPERNHCVIASSLRAEDNGAHLECAGTLHQGLHPPSCEGEQGCRLVRLIMCLSRHQEFPTSCTTPKARGPTHACVSASNDFTHCLLTNSFSLVVSAYLISFTFWKFHWFPNDSVLPSLPMSLTIFCLNI